MGFVIVVVLLAIGFFVALVVMTMGGSAIQQREIMAKAPETTGSLFDGRRQVSYKRDLLNGLPDDVLLEAADKAGYDLTTRDTAGYETTLTFTKR